MNVKRTSAIRRGFTLVELLVVIGIIALLAAILLPAMNAAMKKADKVRAQNEMNSIVAAVKAYYADYGKMPAPPGNDGKMRNGNNDFDYGWKGIPYGQNQNKVIHILRGSNAIYQVAGAGGATLNVDFNPHRTVYLQVPDSSMEGDDLDNNHYTKNEGYFLDPWGTPYQICMDTSFDGVTKFTLLRVPPFKGGSGWVFNDIPGQQVAVVSYGPTPHELKDVLNSWGGDAVVENP